MCLIRFIFSAFAILGTFSHNQGNAEALEPNTKLRETKPQITSSDKRMRGIVLVSNAAAFSQLDLNQIRGISIDEGLSFLDSFEALRESLKTQFLDREINSENLLLIKNEILAHYNQYQQNMITVEIPEQEVTQGVVVLEIKTAQIGTVSYSGNRWYSKERVAKKLSLYSGKPIDQNTLLNDVSWLNQNPFHYTKVVLSPGEKKKSDQS